MSETNKKKDETIPWGCIGAVLAALIAGLCGVIVALPNLVPLLQPKQTQIIPVNPVTTTLAPTVGTNSSDPTNQSSILTGVWDFKITANQIMGQDGFIQDLYASADWVVKLNQTGEKINGEIIGAKGNLTNVCSDAHIIGTMQDNRINFVVQYTGSCCPNERMTFTGVYDLSSEAITGKAEPIEIPKSDCSLWFSDIVATKR